MPVEIERKFLVNNDNFKKDSFQKKTLKQGYLNSNKNRTVRVRVADERGYITIKGSSNISGTTRYEWEKEIPLNEALELLKLCEKTIIEKTRYLYNAENHIYEIDVFEGENKGLIIAEIELKDEFENFTKPTWLGKEVTGDSKYYNASLSKKPYKNWELKCS